MRYKVDRRVFSRGPHDKKTTLSLSVTMHDRLETLATDYGHTIPALVSIILDQYLIQEAKDGNVEWPRGFDPKTLES